MSEAERIVCLERENEQLRKENEMLTEVVSRMRVTLNRLIQHYITGDGEKKTA